MRAVFALAVLATALAAMPAFAVPVAPRLAGDDAGVKRVADLDWTPRARRRHLPRDQRRLGTPDYIYYPEQYFCLYPRYDRR